MGLLTSLLLAITYFVILCIGYLIYILHSHKKYFKKHNVPYLGVGFTRFLKMIIGKQTFVQSEIEAYQEAAAYNYPVVGFTNMFNLNKAIYITDMDMLKNVYVKDFDHFTNRPPFITGSKNDILAKMLFAMENEQWKTMRAKMSPMFTTGKIKRMFENFQKSSEGMTTYIKNHIGSETSKDDLDFSEVFLKYTMDVIAATAFGFDIKTWDVPVGQQSVFEQMGKRYQFSFAPLKLLQFLLMVTAPKLYNLLGLEIMDGEAERYFTDLIKQTIKQRRQTGERREDFLQLILDIQDGVLKEDGDKDENIIFDDSDLVAFSMQFLLAGFDTTQSALIFALYSITLEQQVQENLYEEISSKINSNGGKLTYDSLMEMTYHDYVINESLRMYHPQSQTNRVCTKNYSVPGTNFTIEKGTMVMLPMYPAQYDDRHYPNPEKFIPERFSPENKQTRSPYAWSPFGHGPRGCIAMRFALIKVKTLIAHLVYSFQFSPCEKTLIPMEFSDGASLKPKTGLWMNVTPRK